MNETWTRRQLLKQTGAAAAAAAGLGLVGCTASDATPKKRHNKDLQYFVSRPDLTPPKVKLTHVEPGHPLQYLFLGLANSGPGEGGAMIMDTTGELVWFSPDTVNNSKMDFQRQFYHGKPVLTWFQGRVISGGHGEGVGIVADPSYQTVATIHGHNGLKVDLHEFVVTPRGTAQVTAYRTLKYDLSPYGGPKDGVLWSGVAQEIDIATGKLVFQWDSIDHVPISESYLTKFDGTEKKPYDYFHINTIADAPDGSGDLLIGARNTWSVYKVSRKTGQIIWRLNGKLSDFTMAPGSEFYWQHDTRPHGPNILTVFDDGWDAVMAKDEKQSRALVLNIDYNAMLVTLQRQYVNTVPVLARAMGNTQLLPGGGVFVGWGTNPYFSEYSADGKLLLEGQLTKHAPTYRSFIGPWTGRPADVPAVAARRRPSGAMVYASWNGATEVASWRVLAGKAKTALAPVASARKSGFETAIAVRSKGPYFAAEARDAKGHVLARSNPVKIT
jgi:hypothetical protein